MRIGYFGGSFDPPHIAHLHVAQSAADAFGLDRVLLAPTGVQPLKDHAPFAAFEDRMAMTRLLCAEDPRLEVSALDAPYEDGSPNFTLDAMERLRAETPGAEIFLIVGADSFLSLPRWHEPQRLLNELQWIVVSRPENPMDDLSPLALSPQQRERVHLLTSMDEDVSATAVRERLRVGVSCGKMLTPPVALYIARMHLYHAR